MPTPYFAGSIRGTLQNAKIDFTTASATLVAAPGAGKRIILVHALIISGGTTNLKWQSGSTDLTGDMPFVANLGMVDDVTVPEHGLRCNINEALVLANSGSVQVSGYLTYIIVGSEV